MWLCVDRIEGDTVVLTDDDERVYRMSVETYMATVGRLPAESDMLSATAENGDIRTAAFDPSETEARAQAARDRLNRLFGRKKS